MTHCPGAIVLLGYQGLPPFGREEAAAVLPIYRAIAASPTSTETSLNLGLIPPVMDILVILSIQASLKEGTLPCQIGLVRKRERGEKFVGAAQIRHFEIARPLSIMTNRKLVQVDTFVLGLSHQKAAKFPYIASMGVYVFKTDVLLQPLKWTYPSCNDFGSEIIHAVVKDLKVQAYLFNDYWEDIGTIRSLFDANLALTEQIAQA